MNMLIAYIQPFMESRVMEVLHGMEEVSGATFSIVRGFGRGRLADKGERGLITATHKVRLEIVVSEKAVAKVRDAIRAAAHTGKAGDGKVFVLPVSGAVRISTGEEAEQAI